MPVTMKSVDINECFINSLKKVIGLLQFKQDNKDLQGLSLMRSITNILNLSDYYGLSDSQVQSMVSLFYKITRNNPDFVHLGIYIDNKTSFNSTVSVPVTMRSAGMKGWIAFDNNFFYRCTKTGTDGNALWVRTAMSTNWQ